MTSKQYQASITSLLRRYLTDHDRCSSEDNPDGRRCWCDICRHARAALKGKRGASLAAVHEVVDAMLDEVFP
jgi:hypothetical protein